MKICIDCDTAFDCAYVDEWDICEECEDARLHFTAPQNELGVMHQDLREWTELDDLLTFGVLPENPYLDGDFNEE